jgi:predicted aldo/keto reductase-like oxidoreductase
MASGNVDEGEAVKILHEAIDSGLNYLDTAYIYHDGLSEVVTGKALKNGYRDKVYVATKSPTWYIEKESDFDRLLDEQLKRLGMDYIDFYLIHSLNASLWDGTVTKLDILGKAEKALKAGKIKHLGFSFHDDLPVFKRIVDEYDKWEFCLIQTNYLNETKQAGIEGMLYATAKGLGVIGMGPLMGGRLSNPHPAVVKTLTDAKPDWNPTEWALNYVWDKPEVSLLLSGMSDVSQLRQNLAYASKARPNMLTAQDKDVIKAVQQQFAAIHNVPCTSCNYCLPCPAGVKIPSNFSIYNELAAFETPEASKGSYEFMRGQDSKSTAENCVKCGECEPLCPQQIKIANELANVAKAFS